ncbi:SGNH/GDSL hydrolase family protein [Dictyobacter vulcani]|uniref:SGNH/GDSL hydrolase family protein n=1 Tax=Dictyobacter vulcani TaxID=2607529 RepID=UPI0013872842|nr:GDSL-type esterase/lipase family protein [Dictyobacter vulcani]
MKRSCSNRERATHTFNSLFCCLLISAFLAACVGIPDNQSSSSHLHLQPTPAAHLTYVAIGASDTFGTGTNDPATQCWPASLIKRLGPDARLINLGIPGIDAHDALNIEVPVALDSHAHLITVWLAVNDLIDKVPLASYQKDLASVLQRLQAANPQARIFVANVPDLTVLPRFAHSDKQALRSTIFAYNSVIATVVAGQHVILVDLYQTWQTLSEHPEYISADGFHPNASGYAVLAEIFYDTLQMHHL